MQQSMLFQPKPFPAIPTTKEMDDANDDVRVNLLLIRCLMTSDMAFFYQLLKPDTLRDIARTLRQLLAQCDRADNPRQGLSEDERNEYVAGCITFEEYATLLDS